MNKLIIPPSPNWYEPNILTCALNNTVIYGSQAEIVIIKPRDSNEPADVKIIHKAHADRVICVNAAPFWDSERQLVVSAGEDRKIKLWDVESCDLKSSHNGHTINSDKVVSVTFAGNDRIVSVSEDGFIIIWLYITNKLVSLKDLLGPKVKVTNMSSCPHSPWLTAFGLRTGLVVIADLRRKGSVMYRLRGHERNVLAFSWCPLPYNFLDKKAMAKKENRENKEMVNGILKDILENVCVERKIEPQPKLEKKKKPNPWINLKHADDDDFPAEQEQREPVAYEDNDFLSDCASLMKDIKKLKGDEESGDDSGLEDNVEIANERVADKENIPAQNDNPIQDNCLEEAHSPSGSSKAEGTQEINVSEDDFPKEYLLASSARGGSIIIWQAFRNGRVQMELRLSNRSSKSRNVSDKSWISLLWIRPNILLSSSSSGDLLEWNFEKLVENGTKLKPRIVLNDHKHNLFTIAAPLKLFTSLDELNWREKINTWTFGQDRYLLNTSISADREVHISYPTIGSHINCFASSPLDPNRIAIGFGDGFSRVWDLSRQHTQYIEMNNLWQKHQGRIIALAWHHSKESILAFGTLEGRVGIVDTTNTTKPPILLAQYFQSAVHHLEWAPVGSSLNTLFACSEGKLFVYDADAPIENPIEVQTPEKEYITQFSWKSDFSMLAVGLKTGSLLLYSSDLTLLQTLYVQQKSMLCIRWHPEAASENKGESPYAGWVACCTKDNSIAVYDCFDLSKENHEVETPVIILKSLVGLKSLAWSPHEGNKLIGVGEDGHAEVWDVVSQKLIASFASPNLEGFLDVVWSPLDPDFVITGGKENVLRVWRLSEHAPLPETEYKELVKKSKKQTKSEKASCVVDQQEPNAEVVKPKKVTRENLLHTASKLSSGDSQSALEDCERLLSSYENNYSVDALQLFKGKEEMLNLLKCEEELYMKKGKIGHATHISLWKGDISETIKAAIANGSVTPFLINLAPMVSPRLWMEACEVYARKSSESPNFDPIETSSYFLACHKLDEAINVLCTGNMYREALALAKCRLPENDPTINDIIRKWATYCRFSGNFEVAAQCYISLGEFEEASKVLFRRSDAKSLELSLKLAEKTENKDLYNAVLVRFNAFANAECKNEKTEASCSTDNVEVVNSKDNEHDTKS